MAATYMFEPGWILIGFIENRLGDTKQFKPARLKPIPIFYGTPNFPIIIVQTQNSSPTQISTAATNMFEPYWILMGLIEDRLGDSTQFDSARLKPNRLLALLKDFDLKQCVTEPTHTGDHILDLVIVRSDCGIEQVHVDPHAGQFSDTILPYTAGV